MFRYAIFSDKPTCCLTHCNGLDHAGPCSKRGVAAKAVTETMPWCWAQPCWSQILCGLAQSNFKGPVDADLLQGLATKTELKMLREKVVASEE